MIGWKQRPLWAQYSEDHQREGALWALVDRLGTALSWMLHNSSRLQYVRELVHQTKAPSLCGL